MTQSTQRALRIYAGPKARAHLREHGLLPAHIDVIPGAAGGPKGLILGPMDRFLFGSWLPQSDQPIHLVGASIGAWRMATACLASPIDGFIRLERDYVHQDYSLAPGQKRPTAQQVSESFQSNLQSFYSGRISEVLHHPRYRLHVLCSRGKHLLRREHALLTPLGYAMAYFSNALNRRWMGIWLERTVFSSLGAHELNSRPFGIDDFATRELSLTKENFLQAVQASCSIPFALKAVPAIAGAPAGAYWDGGITDYHLHLNYRGLVLYPHFQRAVVPGWLDKQLKARHRPTAFLDNTIVLAPDPAWVACLPHQKLPDRTDFVTYRNDLEARIKNWTIAISESQRLADEFSEWLNRPDFDRVEPL
ncbi:MAG: patatin-like phospholipase family protein [Betaproteobacteria bacterium]|jgi:hypothetical protein|nr:patatin-like phospholipase family protein [Betaproteobacteria bacterium]